jgi:hypothetical protein
MLKSVFALCSPFFRSQLTIIALIVLSSISCVLLFLFSFSFFLLFVVVSSRFFLCSFDEQTYNHGNVPHDFVHIPLFVGRLNMRTAHQISSEN